MKTLALKINHRSGRPILFIRYPTVTNYWLVTVRSTTQSRINHLSPCSCVSSSAHVPSKPKPWGSRSILSSPRRKGPSNGLFLYSWFIKTIKSFLLISAFFSYLGRISFSFFKFSFYLIHFYSTLAMAFILGLLFMFYVWCLVDIVNSLNFPLTQSCIRCRSVFKLKQKLDCFLILIISFFFFDKNFWFSWLFNCFDQLITSINIRIDS